jgi:hypothetical protein
MTYRTYPKNNSNNRNNSNSSSNQERHTAKKRKRGKEKKDRDTHDAGVVTRQIWWTLFRLKDLDEEKAAEMSLLRPRAPHTSTLSAHNLARRPLNGERNPTSASHSHTHSHSLSQL